MIRNLITTVLFLLLSTAAFAAQPCAIVSVGGADVDFPPGEGGPPNNDANLSLIAQLGCDGSVKGKFNDSSAPFFAIHVDITCLMIEGDDAWISGVITKVTPATLGDFSGIPISLRVRDNGSTANDPPDQASFYQFAATPDECLQMPDYDLWDLNNGQVQIMQF